MDNPDLRAASYSEAANAQERRTELIILGAGAIADVLHEAESDPQAHAALVRKLGEVLEPAGVVVDESEAPSEQIPRGARTKRTREEVIAGLKLPLSYTAQLERAYLGRATTREQRALVRERLIKYIGEHTSQAS
jgi:hypothetical protein